MKKALIAVFSLCVLLVGCTGKQVQSDSKAEPTGQTIAESEIEAEATSQTLADSEVKEKNSSYTVTDVAGREIVFDKVPETTVVMGHGALKLYTYVCGDDKLIGIEETEKKGHTVKGQSIHYAYPDLRNLESIGEGGSKVTPNYEQLTYKNPDVIFIASHYTKEELDEMQEKVSTKVVGISSGKTGNVFDEENYQTFQIIGKTMNMEERANEIVDYIKNVQSDLKGRTESIPNKKQVYIGGCSYRGAQGILSSKTKLDLLSAVSVENIMDSQTDERSVIIDKEKLIDMDPEIIILDMSGQEPIHEDMAEDPELYKKLLAFQNDNVYAIMPYFTYGMNYDTAILNMYYIGKTMYPEQFEDVDISEQAKVVYTVFVKKDVYGDLTAAYPEAFKEFKLEQ